MLFLQMACLIPSLKLFFIWRHFQCVPCEEDLLVKWHIFDSPNCAGRVAFPEAATPMHLNCLIAQPYWLLS